VSVVRFEGHFRSRFVEVAVSEDTMKFTSSVPGRPEHFEWPSCVVDSENRVSVRMANRPEFFSLGIALPGESQTQHPPQKAESWRRGNRSVGEQVPGDSGGSRTRRVTDRW
jgi:hypothetical protein